MKDETVLENLETSVVGRNVRFFDSVKSTNDTARKLAEEGAKDGTVVVAETQTAGRGRYGKVWFSPPGSIFMTVILRPEQKVPVQTACAMGTVAVCDAVQAETPLSPQILWPNDVVINDRKIAGVLVESSSCILLGIGLNVNVPRTKMPAELKKTATSLSIEMGKKVDRERLLVRIISEIDALYAAWSAGQTQLLEEEWRSLSATLGTQVVAVEKGLSYEGRAVDVSIINGLVLELPEGGTRTFLPDVTSLVTRSVV